jgi:hypothetical protein
MANSSTMPLPERTIVPGRLEQRFDTTMTVRFEQGSGVTRNVSASGIYFVTDAAFEKGMQISFTLDFDDFLPGPLRLKCEAQVVRVEQHEGKLGVAAAISTFELARIERRPDEHS